MVFACQARRALRIVVSSTEEPAASWNITALGGLVDHDIRQAFRRESIRTLTGRGACPSGRLLAEVWVFVSGNFVCLKGVRFAYKKRCR